MKVNKKIPMLLLAGLSIFLTVGCSNKEIAATKNNISDQTISESNSEEKDNVPLSKFSSKEEFEDLAYTEYKDKPYREIANSYIGKEAFNFTFLDENGTEKSIADYKGQKIILELMATWCEDCTGLISDIETYREETKLPLLSIAYLEEKEAVDEFLNTYNGKANLLLSTTDSDLITSNYDIQYVPTILYIDEQGIIKNAIVGIGSLDILQEAEYWAFNKQ